MSYFDYRGKRICFEENGAGEPLLLLHGNTASGKMFAPFIPVLAAKYHVIVLDFLGCGQSDRLEQWPADLWYEWSDQAASLCKYMGIENINVIGCSGGALAAINIALENPEMVNAVIADSFEGLFAKPDITSQISMGRDFAKQNEGFRTMLRAMHGEDWESVVDSDTGAVVRHAREIGSFLHQPIEKLAVKMLLTGSREDELFPEGHYDALFHDICDKTDFARMHIFEHGGHPAMMSNITEFISLCEEFFNK